MSNSRIYILFLRDEDLQSAMRDALLSEQEQANVMYCVRNCIFDGNMRRTLVVQGTGKRLPQSYRAMAREIYEHWPEEDRIAEAKNSTGTDAAEGIRTFGAELPIYTGKLHNFA